MNLLFVASDPMEFRGLITRAARIRPEKSALDWVRRGELAGNEALFVANGVGWARASAAVDRALQSFPADAVISTGYCGALHPDLLAGDIVVGASVLAGGERFKAVAVAGGGRSHQGHVCSVQHVVSKAEEKSNLRQTGASAVEMEAAGVARRARERGLPFYCIRAVIDLAAEDLDNDFNSALRPDGHFDTMRILGNVLRRPSVRLPELIRFRNRCVRASHALGEFFANCRF